MHKSGCRDRLWCALRRIKPWGMQTGGPISLATPMRFAADPPAQADVVVIGGGIAGVATALYLAEAGRRFFLCENGRIAGEQSSRNWGWVRQQGRDPVVNRAPVGDDQALEAELLAQHGGEQPGVLGGGQPVDLVVGAHHRPRL